MRWLLVAGCWSLAGSPALALQQPPAPQNPSPMAESTRAHERLTPRPLAGTTRSFMGPAGKTVELFIPARLQRRSTFDLVVHLHGAAFLPHRAVADLNGHSVAAVLNIGTGSGVYHRTFADPATFDSLLAGITRDVSAALGRPMAVGRITLTGFSAGHGAIRAILLEARHFERVDAILLLDGMHTSYVPEGKVLADSGALDTTNLAAFARFARAAVRGEKRFLVTHSEIFPGTFASTTETSDWLIHALGVKRRAVLTWGPRGLQQLSEVRAGQFHLMGFAGNSAPDHVDHLHAMPELLRELLTR
jgi:hypothetical protein